MSVRLTGAPILLDRDCTGGSFFPSNTAPTIQCAQTCETNTVCGEAQVPSDHLKRCIECNGNGNNCMDVGSDGNGVSNADFILYVSATTTGSCPTAASEGGGSPTTIAFASSCQMESALDRPIAGNLNFCPLAFGSNDDDFIFIVTKHEVLHALAFSDGLFPFWRDENGTPRSERNEFGFPPEVNTGQGTRFTWSDSTIREVVYNDWEVFGDTVSHMVYLLVTPAVVEEGRRHFNCSNLEGVELENQGGSGTMLSHWEKRILGDELMTGTIGSTAVISNFSLALLRDTGWYQVNYGSSEQLVWGKNAGCTFASRSCLSYMNEQRNSGNSISPFCDVTNNNDLGCTVDKLFVGQCSLSTFTGNLPKEYQYFSQPNQGGSLEIADFCPFYVSFSISGTGRDTECSNPNNQPPAGSDLSAEQYGEGSRCFEHSTHWTIGGTERNPFGAGCYQYTCNEVDDNTLTILVRDTSSVCTEPGDTVDVSFPSQFGQYVGSIQCPSSFDQYCMIYDSVIGEIGSGDILRPTTSSTTTPTPTGTTTPNDGCRSNITDIPSHSGNPNLTISIEWPETKIGELAEVDCPCGTVTSQEGSLIATRYCGGDFTNGGQWENPNVASCNFSDLAREICQLTELQTGARLQQLNELIANSDNLGPTEVIVSVDVLLTAIEEVSGNLSLTEDFLSVVDNIINIDVETLQQSQESSNTSAKILEAIESVVEEIPLGNTSEPVVITRSAFAVSAQQVDLDQVMEIGQTFSANLGTFSDLNMSENIDSNDLSFSERTGRPTASISLPNNLFNAILNVTNNTRITHAVFLSDSLFLRRENNDMEVGGIIISASLVGSNSVEGIDPPLNITFLKNPNISGSDPQCSFWNPMLDDGYGDWSSEGCEIDESYRDSRDVVTCFCDHLTSFCVLLDVSPEIQPPEGTLVLEAVTYIGIIVSIFCLLITIISYLSSKELRTSEHGQLLVNLCFALMGLYITFIFAIHSRTVTGLCAVSAAVLQYFFLVTFLLMAAEAINLYMKLVIVLGANIPHFVLKATIISWLTPILIVLFCFAPDYKNYVSDHFCRAFNIPYYIGMVVPFLVIYIFNWTIFFIIIVTLLHKSCKTDLKDVKEKQENISFIRRQLIIVTTLSVLFGLGWGIGLFATQDIHKNKIVRDVFAALFVVVTAFHGLFIFIMQCLRSKEVRSVWKQWFYRITGKDFSSFSSLTYGRIRRTNTSRTDSTSDGANLKQYFSKQSLTSPGGNSSVFTFDDNTLEIDADTLKVSVDKSSFPLSLQEDAIILENLGKDEEEVDHTEFPDIPVDTSSPNI